MDIKATTVAGFCFVLGCALLGVGNKGLQDHPLQMKVVTHPRWPAWVVVFNPDTGEVKRYDSKKKPDSEDEYHWVGEQVAPPIRKKEGR